jgi:probable HAF family extracellular repeat protein
MSAWSKIYFQAALLVLTFTCSVELLYAAEFIPLGDLPGGIFESRTYGVSADGRVVVGGSSGNSIPGLGGDPYFATERAFVWTQDAGMTEIAGPARATDVSADGSVVVGYLRNRDEAFSWTASEGVTRLGVLPGYTGSQAFGVSAEGATIVGHSYAATSQAEAFVWNATSGMIGLGHRPGSADSRAADVSADGRMIVGRVDWSTDADLAIWVDRIGPQVLDASGLGSIIGPDAQALSPDGSVVVGWGGSGRGWRWTTDEGMVLLDRSWSPSSDARYYPTAASNAGEYIVGFSYDAVGAFLWDRVHGIRSLQQVLTDEYGLGSTLDGWTLTHANDISPNGQYIAGSATNLQGNREAFLVRLDPVPEPTAGLLAVLGGLIIIAACKRRFIQRFDPVSVREAGGTLSFTKKVGFVWTSPFAVQKNRKTQLFLQQFDRVQLGNQVSRRLCVLTTVFMLTGLFSLQAQSIEWIRQYGTGINDYGRGVSVDRFGSIYVAGDAQAEGGDPVLRKLNENGDLQWSRTFGDTSFAIGSSVSADGLGNVYFAGYTFGDLGGTNAGAIDGYLSKYDSGGTLAWIRQFGTSGDDRVYDLSADGLGNIFLVGYLNGPKSDGYLSKYNDEGISTWIRQFDSGGNDFCNGVAADGLGNVYVTGSTYGDLGGTNAGATDVFVSKYDTEGTLLWMRQQGTSGFDKANSVTADGNGNVYISGITKGSLGGLNAGEQDAFLSKYDADGTLLWTQQLGTTEFDESQAVSADGLGHVYISGRTFGNLGGSNAGQDDAFVGKYDANGSLLWLQLLGTGERDVGLGMTIDAMGNVFVTGFTEGNLGQLNEGGTDVFVVKFRADLVPEPAAGVLAALGAGILASACTLRSSRKASIVT